MNLNGQKLAIASFNHSSTLVSAKNSSKSHSVVAMNDEFFVVGIFSQNILEPPRSSLENSQITNKKYLKKR